MEVTSCVAILSRCSTPTAHYTSGVGVTHRAVFRKYRGQTKREEWRLKKDSTKSSTDVVGKTGFDPLIPAVIFYL